MRCRCSLPAVGVTFLAAVLLQGCSAIVRSAVNTQPRVELSDGAFEQPSAVVRGEPVVYAPGIIDESATADPDLARYAPIVVQGFQRSGKTRYPRTSDAIGTPTLAEDGDGLSIDTDEPAVFARVEHALVGDAPLKQLVYVFWYPERPVGTIEQGDIDGGILRITLDAQSRPAVFEYSQPCGCFHGVFVARHVEDAARQQFPNNARNRLYAVEPPLGGHDDWVVRDVVEVHDAHRPVLYMSAGKHFCEAIRFREPPAAQVGSTAIRPYELRPYEALEQLPAPGGGNGSMFNEKGLVHGGKRWKENFLLTGLDNPGWPRHLDMMKIHWDKDTWTDAHLLERRLRLPASFSGTEGNVTSADTPISAPVQDAIALPELHSGRPTLILFTNRYCIGCEDVKQHVMSDAAVQAALADWDYHVLDTALPEAAAAGARHRVTMTPVLVAFDGSGRELMRSEDLDTPAKVLGVLEEAAEKAGSAQRE